MRRLRANDFSLGFPSGWTDHSTITLVGPPRETFTHNVQVHRESRPQGIDIADYLRTQRADLGRQLDSYQLLWEGDRLIGGHPAVQHQVRWRVTEPPAAGLIVRQQQVAVARAGVLYTITLSAEDEHWPAVETQFEQILDLWEFVEAEG
jgi:hypothetical protein